MAAAYAALVCLMNIMEQLQNHPRLSTSLDRKQIQSLGENISFLLEFVEGNNSHEGTSKETEDLEREIASAAQAAEDVIELHVVKRIRDGNGPSFLIDLQKIVEGMDSIKEKIVKVEEERGFKYKRPRYSEPAAAASSTTTHATGKIDMVGFEGYLNQLLDGLTGPQFDRQIVSLVGMGGIGKTTLARNVYESSVIVRYFDVLAWVTISQQYSVTKILLDCLSRVGEYSAGMETVDELGERLYKFLSGRRYLIVLDDMWSIDVWSTIRWFFPENNNKSRIVVTTRLVDVANNFGSLVLHLKFLGDDISWDLFCAKAFAEEGCPLDLEEIGKKIVKKCQGLPLSIVVIGGLLGKSSREQEYWEKVEKNLSSILNSAEDSECLNLLHLSYSYLPAYLQPCFLYLGVFPEDDEIRVTRLIKLWVAEGFLKPNKDKSLEETAEIYIKELIDRNLLLVSRLRRNGKIKTCNIHDLLRDLSIRVAEKEKFFWVMREVDTNPQEIDRQRRVVISDRIAKEEHHPRVVFHKSESTSLARSVIGQSINNWLSLRYCKLLRVLYNAYGDSMETTFQQVNLRFFRCYFEGRNDWIATYKLPSSISLLWNLQTLILVRIGEVVAPSQIWEMPQLRHFECGLVRLPPPPPTDEQDFIVLRNLQTISIAQNLKLTEEVCMRIPNIKKLYLIFNDDWESKTMSYYCIYNVGRCLNKVESLHYEFVTEGPTRDELVHSLRFPSSLKKLTLRNCKVEWHDLTMIGLLPHLRVLKMEWNSAVGGKWEPVEGEFEHLKYLEINHCHDLVHWNADKSHFPVLEKLVVQGLLELDEIPLVMGDIATLESIFVENCSISAAVSAIKILEEQESYGNEGIQVRVEFWNQKRLEEFKEQMEMEGLTTDNFQMRVYSDGVLSTFGVPIRVS